MVWHDPEKDGKIAKRLQDGIAERLKTENDNLTNANERVSKLNDKIAKDGTSTKLENQLKNAKADAEGATTLISELNSSSRELTEMGSDAVVQEFTFKEIVSSEGDTYMEKGVITMEIVNDVNGVHEATHGWQVHTGKITGEGKGKMRYSAEQLYSNEISAYRRQYSYDPASVKNTVPSYPNNAKSIADITQKWLLGINNSGDFIYGRILLGVNYSEKAMRTALDALNK